MSVACAVRLRPAEEGPNDWVVTSSSTIASDGREHRFDFAFSRETNGQVFNISCREIVERVIEGFNGTIAAYGQSGSGKTHSLLGSNGEQGILQLAVKHLLNLITERTAVQYMVKLCAYEVYNEVLNDLLDDSGNGKCRLLNGKVVGGTEEIVESFEHFRKICQRAQDRRKVGETALNQKSSRSHAIFQLVVESCELNTVTGKQVTIVSKLVVLDLAGSENAQTMTNMVQTAESKNINLSLLALSRVISELSEDAKNKFIPYRDSMLTRILKPVLGGNSQFLLICCIRKAASSETSSTISFGQKAKKMPNHVAKNVETGDAALPALLAQMNELRRQLEEQKKETQEQDKKRLEDLLKKVLNSKPEFDPPKMEKKRRHSFAFGANSFSSETNRRGRQSAEPDWNQLMRVEEEELLLDSGRSSRMSVDERQPTPEMDILEENRDNEIIHIPKCTYDWLMAEWEGAKTLIVRLTADLEERESEDAMWQEKFVTLQQKCEDLEKQLISQQTMGEAAILQRKEESDKMMAELKTEADKYVWKYEDLKKRGLEILQEKSAAMEKLQTELKAKEEEINALKEELSQKVATLNQNVEEERKKRKKIGDEMERARRLVEKCLEEERQLRMKATSEQLMEQTEKKALQEKLDELTSAARGVSSTMPQHCANPIHTELLHKVDVLVRQRQLLVDRLNERDTDVAGKC
ncbi:unnamed protein product [Caenorhabditis sp. 36 PRJEB53466]|nr:unnamed protein product [Caenorhabditis sp. 36 PRJEB53466]